MDEDTGPESGSHPVARAPVAFRQGSPGPRRRDARANRARVLAAAAGMATEGGGLLGVTVDEIAERAGVGKGTVYRAFGDKAGIGRALLDAAERELQGAILDGPPPLGLGAPALDRVLAFAHAYVELLDRRLDLFLLADQGPPGSRYRTGAYAFWHAHLMAVLGAPADAAGTAADVEGAAHAILALVDPDLFFHLRRERHFPAKRIMALVESAACGIVSQACSGA